MRAIRSVAFDLWGTLIADDADFFERRIRLRSERMLAALAAAGCRKMPDELRAAYRAGWFRAEEVRRTGLDVSSRQQVALFLDALEPGLALRIERCAAERIGEVYTETLIEMPPDPVPGALEALRACHQAGARTALVSNTGQTPGRVLRRTLAKLGLAGFIDVWLFSDEIRLSKPNPAIFRHLLGMLGTAPGETLFVGDTPELDVLGARAAGLPVLQIGEKRGGGPPPDGRSRDLCGFVATLRTMGLCLSPTDRES